MCIYRTFALARVLSENLSFDLCRVIHKKIELFFFDLLWNWQLYYIYIYIVYNKRSLCDSRKCANPLAVVVRLSMVSISIARMFVKAPQQQLYCAALETAAKAESALLLVLSYSYTTPLFVGNWTLQLNRQEFHRTNLLTNVNFQLSMRAEYFSLSSVWKKSILFINTTIASYLFKKKNILPKLVIFFFFRILFPVPLWKMKNYLSRL